MTLIACIQTKTDTVLFTDYLLSSAAGNSSLKLPTVGTAHTEISTSTGCKAYSAANKLFKISDTMMVAYAGDVGAAVEALSRLSLMFADHTPEVEYLNKILDGSFSDLFVFDLSLMIVVRNGNSTHLVHRNCTYETLPGLGPIWVAGSGIAQLREVANATGSSVGQIFSHPHPYGPLAAVLFICGTLLGSEVNTGKPLRDSFGMFYEIAVCSADKFLVHTDSLFVIWQFPETDKSLPFIRKIMRRVPGDKPCDYYSMDYPTLVTGQLSNETVIRVVSGLDGPPVPPLFQRPNLNASYQVNVFIGWNPWKAGATYVRLKHAVKIEQHLVRFLDEGTILNSYISNTELESAAARLRHLVANS